MQRRRSPRLSLDLLRGFQAAARLLSFTRAAQELNVTQPAISREIKTLEAQLGQPLFHRAGRTLALTQAGEQLFRATDEALALIDDAATRVAGGGETLSMTTTPALASTWLVPRLGEFTRRHPRIDVRIMASNDQVDLDREQLDLALRYVPPWADAASGERLVDYFQFPVCAPSLLRRRRLRVPADLARHVRLDFETILYGRRWYDWTQWCKALDLPPIEPAGTLCFSHYDQVIESAIDGAGVAIGKWPHLARHLRAGVLCVPLGREWVARLGGFHVVLARRSSARDAVAAFVRWLGAETHRDRERAPASLGFADAASSVKRSAARSR